MSHYTTGESEVKDQEAFISALIECWPKARGKELTRDMIEIHETPVNLQGYQGDTREQKANIVIRKHNVGTASNDIGYLIENGKATEYISQYDRGHYSNAWSENVKQRYSVGVAYKKMAAKGYKVEEVLHEGQPRLVAKKTVYVG